MSVSARAVAVLDLAAAGATDPGRLREQNEDRFYVDLPSGVFLVVDGVGGEAAGEVAAQIAVQTIVNRLARHDGSAEVRVREAITLANQDIYRHARLRPERSGMACVLTLAVLEGRQLTIGHVGDSRLYKLTPRGMAKLTHDHSPVGEREDAREISETQAMQHARRNEVYRDVGSEPRQPDDPNFIETVLAVLEEDAAILLCSDGLSDMLTSTEIERIVRTFAGNPQRVVDELIAAANDAGGRDNVTAIFAEGPGFSRSSARPVPTQPRPAMDAVSTTPLAELLEPDEPPAGKGMVLRILQSRVLALLLGTIVGVAGTIALLYYAPNPFRDGPAPRRLLVGSSEAGAYATIGDAVAASRAGDTVLVHPGEYAESLMVPAGVTLEASVAGRAVLAAPADQPEWVALTATAGPAVIRGFRIAGLPSAPMHVGIRVLGGGIEVDDVTFEGAIETAIDLGSRGAGVIIRSNRFIITGVPVRVGPASTPEIRQNFFMAGANGRRPAIDLGGGAAPVLDGNVFVDFSDPIAPASSRNALLDGNFVLSPGTRK